MRFLMMIGGLGVALMVATGIYYWIMNLQFKNNTKENNDGN